MEEENRELRDLAKPQRRKRSGVTVGNMGQHHFTDQSGYERVQMADDAGQARKRAKGKGTAQDDAPGPPQQPPEAENLVDWYARQLGASSRSAMQDA